MKTISLLIALVVLVGTFSACDKECSECPKPVTAQSSDVTRPVISVITPDDLSTHIGGEILVFKGVFTDDKALSQYKIEMHNAFDGHTHGKNSAAALPFEFDTIVTISGTVDSQQFNIYLPQDVAAGSYHFIVTALDAAGNEAIFVEKDLTLVNPIDTIAPGFSITYPDFTAPEVELTFGAGKDTLQIPISATLFDQVNDGSPGNLQSYAVVFKLTGTHPKPAHGEEEKIIYQISNSNLNSSSFGLIQTLILYKSDLEHDHEYALELIVKDQKGNIHEQDLKYHIRYF